MRIKTVAAISLLLLWSQAGLAANPVVKTAYGEVEGRTDDNINSFKGVPYAAPPTGKLRWMPPAKPAAWGKPLDAGEFGHACPQPQRPDRRRNFGTQSEDCLTLNIWTPEDAKNAPVMVWIHGGAFRIGKAGTPFYDGTNFAKNGVVLVSINYRLGHLGFFHHPELAQENADQPLGNYGLMDQVAALEWVRDNIAAFGGNPEQVTIFGESAGGASVLALMTAEPAYSLFHQAIVQSGGGMSRTRHLNQDQPNLISLASLGQQVAKQLGATGDNQIEQLRAIPANDFIKKANAFKVQGGFGPVIDGKLLKHSVVQAFIADKAAKVPLLIGANSYEASVMKALGFNPDVIMNMVGGDLETLKTVYEKDAGDDKTFMAELLFGDATFVAPARSLARVQSVRAPTYLYHLDFVRERGRKKAKGAGHGADILLVFNTLDSIPMASLAFTKNDRKVAQTVHNYWVNFGKTGNPNGEGLPTWPQYHPAADELLLIGNERIAAAANFQKPRLDAVLQVIRKRMGNAQGSGE